MASQWAQRTNYSVGQVVVAKNMGQQWYICTRPGRSGNAVPFDKYTDANGDTIVDYQVHWLTYKFGGVGNIKFTTDSDIAVLTGENLEIGWTYGNSNMKLTRRSGTKDGPRSAVYYIGEEVMQISGVIKGPGTPLERASFKDVFKKRFGLKVITVALTGDHATSWGASLTSMHSGSNSVKIKPVRGHRYFSTVNIQIVIVDNS